MENSNQPFNPTPKMEQTRNRDAIKTAIREAVHMATVNQPFVLPALSNIAGIGIELYKGEYSYFVMKHGGTKVYHTRGRSISPTHYKTESRARKALCEWLISDWIPAGGDSTQNHLV